MQRVATFAAAYAAGLRDLLEGGAAVESVTDPTSKASNFGRADRPSIELLGYGLAIERPESCLMTSTRWTPNLPYCFGLLAWTLTGQDDVAPLAYYRPGATEFSDDGYTLGGSFGRRIFGRDRGENQLDAILRRIRADAASRRTFASISRPDDNFQTSREYPCAIGMQFFLRDNRLHATTFMRAQQALTVLPYDAFLFISIQLLASATAVVDVGE
jgi:hypothetical protein